MAFRHYLITCLNVGLFSHRKWRPGTEPSPDDWMAHRVWLFETFTLPSVRGQRCRDFVWLVFLDQRTPPRYKRWIERHAIDMPRLIPVYLTCRPLDNERIAQAVIEHTEPGDYDLITTELDSDDAIHPDTIGLIQRRYRSRRHVWAISFVQGVILDLPGRRACLMDYPYHLPTLIEPRSAACSVYRYPNDQMPAQEWDLVAGQPYWLQVVHGENVANKMADGPSRVVRRDCPVPLSALSAFNVDMNAILESAARPDTAETTLTGGQSNA